MAKQIDRRFALSDDFNKNPLAGSPKLISEEAVSRSEHLVSEQDSGEDDIGELGEGMDAHGFSGPKIVKPLTPEALAAFRDAQETAGVIYISRIPPGMQPTKVRHLMSQYGEVGRVYLQREGTMICVHGLRPRAERDTFTDPKRAYLRRKYTTTKKPHYTEGWVEFKDKKVARSVAEMLNAQPIGGKKGTRWRDDVWTLKYLPRFKWYMLTEQVGEHRPNRRKHTVVLIQFVIYSPRSGDAHSTAAS
jgi:ESF2/ABP1 family protein